MAFQHVSIPLMIVVSLSLKRGVLPEKWKEVNIIPVFNKGSQNKSESQRPIIQLQ